MVAKGLYLLTGNRRRRFMKHIEKNAADTSLLVVPVISLMTSRFMDRQSLINDLIVSQPACISLRIIRILKARIRY